MGECNILGWCPDCADSVKEEDIRGLVRRVMDMAPSITCWDYDREKTLAKNALLRKAREDWAEYQRVVKQRIYHKASEGHISRELRGLLEERVNKVCVCSPRIHGPCDLWGEDLISPEEKLKHNINRKRML